jgi:hypothetical protein
MYAGHEVRGFRANSPLIPRQGVSEPAIGNMDSNEIDPPWADSFVQHHRDDIYPSWPQPSVEPAEAGLVISPTFDDVV